MSYPMCPTSLQKRPLREGYERGPARAANQTEVESGPTITRRATRIRSRAEAVSWDLEPAEMELFEQFYDETLIDGTSKFFMPTVDATGTMTSRLVEFVHRAGQRTYRATWSGAAWRVSFDLIVYY